MVPYISESGQRCRIVLTTIRGKQFNSRPHAGGDPLTNAERNAVIIDRRDQQELGVIEGQRVRVKNDHGELVAVVRTGPCRQRHVQAFWPECNVLIPRRYDPVSGEPDYKTTVAIERV